VVEEDAAGAGGGVGWCRRLMILVLMSCLATRLIGFTRLSSGSVRILTTTNSLGRAPMPLIGVLTIK